MRYPGSTCRILNGHADPIDTGTLARTTHHAPGPAGHHKRHHKPRAVRQATMVVFDRHAVAQFLRSVARVTVLARRATMEWVPSKNPGIVEYFDFWISGAARTDTPPGIATLGFGTEATINQDQLKEARKLCTEFVERVRRGADSGLSFLEEQEKVRQRAVHSLEEARAKILAVNRQFREDAAPSFALLVVMKCEATIVWKVGGAFISGIGMFLADIGYDISVAVAAEWDEAKAAELAVVAGKEAAGDIAEEGTKHVTEKVSETVTKTLDEMVASAHVENMQSLSQHIEKFGAEAGASKLPYGARVLRRMNIARAVGSGLGKGLMHGVKFLWLGKNIYSAIADARKSLREID